MKLCELSEEQYNSLKASGMMWEFFPKASGTYEADCALTELHVIEELKRLQKNGYDTEMAHIDADDLLCRFLQTLGYDAIVTAYEYIDKWYS